jgi:hypothetical protein
MRERPDPFPAPKVKGQHHQTKINPDSMGNVVHKLSINNFTTLYLKNEKLSQKIIHLSGNSPS